MLLIVSCKFYSQEYIFGKVISEQNTEISGVLVVNTRTEEETYTNNDGNFMIAAKNTDVLRFVKQKFDRVSYRLQPEDLKKSITINIMKSPVEIEEVEIKSKLIGNLKEDIKRVEPIRKIKINKEISKYIAQKTSPELLRPRGGEFVQPKGEGFFIGGKINNKWDRIDLAENFLQVLGEDYFTNLGLQKSEFSSFIFHVMSILDLKNALKYGYLKSSDIIKFQQLAEIKIKDFRKLK